MADDGFGHGRINDAAAVRWSLAAGWYLPARLCKLAAAHTFGHMAYTLLLLLAALRTRRGTRLATYTYDGKRSFAGKFFGSLPLFLAGFADQL